MKKDIKEMKGKKEWREGKRRERERRRKNKGNSFVCREVEKKIMKDTKEMKESGMQERRE